MGITINDVLMLDCGMTVLNSYASIGSSRVVILKNETGMFHVKSTAMVYMSENAKETGKAAVESFACICVLSSAELEVNLYAKLYENLKSKFISYVDV
jgi:hypothetical protein